MANSGTALIGLGEATGEQRASQLPDDRADRCGQAGNDLHPQPSLPPAAAQRRFPDDPAIHDRQPDEQVGHPAQQQRAAERAQRTQQVLRRRAAHDRVQVLAAAVPAAHTHRAGDHALRADRLVALAAADVGLYLGMPGTLHAGPPRTPCRYYSAAPA